ncbi:extracellular solute-binding protein [Azospirillum sp. TSO5]|uniref:extracellular solute-binding protein n=1 Tax=Azospirillum sp. TSO5 TaxID=716760 RepID=UPI000D6034C4|nr:extracellular solute-binding protein [Azospirillum sp. TSO5]PWC94208.1 ABC transporter substrate-binding protein [Azospirillum sp. TSO5]
MRPDDLSRRTLLTAGGALAASLAMPSVLRAQTKEIVVGGPAGAAKYFNEAVFPAITKSLGVTILYEGSNSLTNLQKMQADRGAPKFSVVIMDDPVMIKAADEGLIVPITAKGSPNLDRLVAGAVHRDGMWANYQRPWAGIAFNSKTPAPASWTDLWAPANKGRVIVPSIQNTEGFWNLLVAAHLETGKPFAEAQYDIDAGFRKLKSLVPSLLNVYTNAPQAMNLLEQGEASMIGGQFSAYTLTRKAEGAPVDLAVPKEGGFAMPSGIAKVKGGPAPDLADAVIDAFLGPAVQQILVEKAVVAPTNTATPRPAGFPDPATLFAPDWAFVAKERGKWAERWTTELL